MAIQDRDGYRQAQREQEEQRLLAANHSQVTSVARNHQATTSGSARQLGLIPMLLFWCAVMGLLYLLMTHYLKPRQAQVMSNGDLVIKRSQDGHFYAAGMVNGVQASFMVDTGASLVTVTEELARKASLGAGVATTFKTANGNSQGRVVDGVGVSVGPVSVTNLRVGVGLRGHNTSDALLGQSFLSKFDIIMGKDQMVIRQR